MEGAMGLVVAGGGSPFQQFVTDAAHADVVNHDTSTIDDRLIEHAINKKGQNFRQAVKGLAELAETCEEWSKNELAASHQRLYTILEGCYAYYLKMKTDRESAVRLDMREALKTFASARKMTFSENANDMTRIVKAVFGADRRRVSAYSLALRAALIAGPLDVNRKPTPIKSADLINWLASQGGVEEIRLGSKNQGLTVKERAEAAKTVLNTHTLDTFKPKAAALAMDTEDIDQMVVLVATYRPTGEFEINALVKRSDAVRAALAAHYSANREEIDSKASTIGARNQMRSAVSRMLETM
jgi:hypothetical protein